MAPINQVVGWANRSTTLSIPALEFCWWLRPTARGIPSHAVKSKNAVAGQILIELPNCSCTQWNNDLGMRMRLHSLWDDVFKAGYMPQFLTEMLTCVNPHSIGEFNLPSNSKCNKLALFDHEAFQLTNQNQPPVHYSYDNGRPPTHKHLSQHALITISSSVLRLQLFFYCARGSCNDENWIIDILHPQFYNFPKTLFFLCTIRHFSVILFLFVWHYECCLCKHATVKPYSLVLCYIFCSVHWADLTWFTFHYWLYSV